MGPVTDTELQRWLVRSMSRLKDMAKGPTILDTDMQSMAWIRWHDQLVEEIQRRGLLPNVPITRQTDVGKVVGAI